MTKAKFFHSGKIGVVTVTYNSETVLGDFFLSLRGQIHTNYVLYVVDNASKDSTIEITQKQTDLPIVLIQNSDNHGVAEGNNQGIRAALADGCECVLLLNNDTVFPPEMIERLYAGLDKFQCDMTTCKMYYHAQPDVFWCAGGHFQPWLGYRTKHDGVDCKDVGQFERPRRITYTPTCCLLVHHSVFERVGLMDAAYFVYSDDVDFLFRCLKLDMKLWYVPEAKLWHKVSSCTGGSESAFTIRYCTRNRIYFMRKHLNLTLACAFYVAYVFYYLLESLTPGKVLHGRTRLRLTSALAGWKLCDR